MFSDPSSHLGPLDLLSGAIYTLRAVAPCEAPDPFRCDPPVLMMKPEIGLARRNRGVSQRERRRQVKLELRVPSDA